MSKDKKVVLGGLLALVFLIVVSAIFVPMLINVDRYRPRVIAHIREETGKPAEIGRLTLTLFPTLSIRVDDFALGNPAAFPRGHVLKVRRIYAELDRDALWNRQILIKSLELNDPVVHLLSDARGRWNFENPSGTTGSNSTSTKGQSLFSLRTIPKVSLSGGQLTAANLLSSGKAGPTYFDASGVSAQLDQVDLTRLISTSALAPPDQSPFPMPHRDIWGASVAYAASQSYPAASGTLKAGLLRFGTLLTTGVKSKLRIFPKRVFFDDSSFELYGGRATGDLTFDFAGQNLRYNASVRLSNVDLGRMLAAFPDARGKMTGKMEGGMKLSGEVRHSPDPLAGMQGVGQLSVRNGQLPTLQLNKNLMLLARLSNLGPASGDPSSFSSISADLNIANQRISSKNIVILGNGVDVAGAGSMRLAGAGGLEYEGIAKLAAGQSPLTNVLIGVLGATLANGKLSLPFNLTGTLLNPKFMLKSGPGGARPGGLPGILAGQPPQQTSPGAVQPQQQPGDLVQGIVGLLNKKKQAQQPQPRQP